jgi:hypothetical protein
MSKKHSKKASAPPASPTFTINLDEHIDKVQNVVDRATNWTRAFCGGRCFPFVGRWWDA